MSHTTSQAFCSKKSLKEVPQLYAQVLFLLQNRFRVVLPEFNKASNSFMDFLFMGPAQEVYSSRKRDNLGVLGVCEELDFFLSISKAKHNITVTLKPNEHKSCISRDASGVRQT